jgi:hypothetical protein
MKINKKPRIEQCRKRKSDRNLNDSRIESLEALSEWLDHQLEELVISQKQFTSPIANRVSFGRT